MTIRIPHRTCAMPGIQSMMIIPPDFLYIHLSNCGNGEVRMLSLLIREMFTVKNSVIFRKDNFLPDIRESSSANTESVCYLISDWPGCSYRVAGMELNGSPDSSPKKWAQSVETPTNHPINHRTNYESYFNSCSICFGLGRNANELFGLFSIFIQIGHESWMFC